MTAQGWLQIAVFLTVLTALTPVVGGYMARVYRGERIALEPLLGPLERLSYRLLRTDPGEQQDWKAYARSVLVFSALCVVALYVILRTQDVHPFNPEGFDSGPWDLSFNTASSFVTNTSWQFYSGETTLSYFSQMAGLAVQSFLSAAVGMVAVIALIRGLASRGAKELGNFWQDLVRTLLYILLPLSFVGALLLASQGVIQTLSGYVTFPTVQGLDQTLALGPVASQEAIKLLSGDGGGFFNVNSAMPFENPTGFSNFLESLFILLIPAALTATFGRMVGSRRQGRALYVAMVAVLAIGIGVTYAAEQHGSPAQQAAGLSNTAGNGMTGGNLEGKEQRFGIANSAAWAAITTSGGDGAMNSGLDSYTGIGGTVPLLNMMTGEVIFGGPGAGLYSMLLVVLLTVFIAGLMVGRTPEYLGKKGPRARHQSSC
ncbi:MAG: potassium-transporting ATPase subunit KdpA [Nocardioidaceae bacterium]